MDRTQMAGAMIMFAAIAEMILFFWGVARRSYAALALPVMAALGGISALALLNKGFMVYLDATAHDYEQIYVSAGQKGLDVKLKVTDFLKVTSAKTADLVE